MRTSAATKHETRSEWLVSFSSAPRQCPLPLRPSAAPARAARRDDVRPWRVLGPSAAPLSPSPPPPPHPGTPAYPPHPLKLALCTRRPSEFFPICACDTARMCGKGVRFPYLHISPSNPHVLLASSAPALQRESLLTLEPSRQLLHTSQSCLYGYHSAVCMCYASADIGQTLCMLRK